MTLSPRKDIVKILMIAPQPFFEPRGTPISVYQRLRGLSELGHEVDLATYPIGRDISVPGVRICRTSSVPFITQVPIGPSWSKLLLDILLFFKVVRLLATKPYDVIHSHEEGAFFGLLLSPIFRTPHLYDMHSSLSKQLKNFKFGNRFLIVRTFEILEHWVLKTARVVLTIGSDLEEYVRQKHSNANLFRIENTAVPDSPTPDRERVAELKAQTGLNNRLPIVYTGNLERYQGLDLLLQSAGPVLRKHPEVAFVIVGGQPEQIRPWQGKVRSRGLEESVFFVGAVSPEEASRYLGLAEILVSPRLDGLSIPLKIYSYLRSGKPIVATNIAAHTRILTDETAVLVEPSPDAYAAGILKLIESPELRQRIGQRARRQAEGEFSMENLLAKLNSAYLVMGQAKVSRAGIYRGEVDLREGVHRTDELIAARLSRNE